jgi:hypothetical protein
VLQDVEFVENSLCLRQFAGDCVDVGLMHVGADRFDGGALPRIETRGQQARQAVLRPILGESDHLTLHQIRQHGVELLRFAPMNLVGAEVSGPALRSSPVPFREKGLLRPPSFAPTDTVPDGGVRATSAWIGNRARSSAATGE